MIRYPRQSSPEQQSFSTTFDPRGFEESLASDDVSLAMGAYDTREESISFPLSGNSVTHMATQGKGLFSMKPRSKCHACKEGRAPAADRDPLLYPSNAWLMVADGNVLDPCLAKFPERPGLKLCFGVESGACQLLLYVSVSQVE